MTRRAALAAGFLLWLCAAASPPAAAQPPASGPRVLGRGEILLFGIGLKAEPAVQTVPKDIATIVSTFLQAPTPPDGLPPFAPDAVVTATLRGPTFPQGLELTVRPNTPFNIPPLRPGRHTLEDIRLVSHGEVLLFATPSTAVIEVIEKLLVTHVTARPLTDAEIREKGIVYDRTNFQAYDFRVAFAVEDKRIPINLTVVLPKLLGAEGVAAREVRLADINTQPTLPRVQTVIPDTLKLLQTQIPNLSVVGFSLRVPQLEGERFFVPPIPGVVVIPGDIGFLNQFFSILLMVGNVAPAGSNLVVTNLRATIVLPPGRDGVAGSGDDPLRMAQTATGPVSQEQPIRQPGPDGRLGTADDIDTLGPGESGNAEYLVEGRREGTHVVEMEIAGTLLGLPVGPVEVRGRAVGSVLVRNPTFTLTFMHPETVTAGEAYTLDVTVTNTSDTSPANQVSLNLHPRFISGATLVGEPTRTIETILPGDSATVSFDLVANVTGNVTAATLESDSGGVNGRFALKTSVGELGIPLSADSLVLPKEAAALPKALRDAALGLLGRAHAVATAPAAALPKDVTRFSKKIVFDRAIEVAQAGLRIRLHEPTHDSAAQLWMDFIGSDFQRLPALQSRPDDLEFARKDFLGFDELRRRSVRGEGLADAVAAQLAERLAAQGPLAFHQDLAQKISYRPGHLAVLAASAGPLPVELAVIDGQQRRVGGLTDAGRLRKEIPFSDVLVFRDQAGAVTARLIMLAAPEPGEFTVRLDRLAGAAPDAAFDLSLVVPDAAGNLRHLSFAGLDASKAPVLSAEPDAPYKVSIQVFDNETPAGGQPVEPASALLPDPPPSIVGAVQQAKADQVCVKPGKTEGLFRPGRIVAVLFSEEVTPESVQDKLRPDEITNYRIENNKVVGVALQPGRRVVFLGLRDGLGPFIDPPRQITISGVADLRGQAIGTDTMPIEITAEDPGGIVSGRVLHADGTPVPFASLRLFYACENASGEIVWIGISQKSADAEGRYSWDYVLSGPRILAVDPETEEFREVRFRIGRHGQRVNLDIVLLGRGTLEGRTLDESGRPLERTAIRVTSLTDNSQYGATTDAAGRFVITRIPVGNIFIEAVNTAARAQFSVSEIIPFAGATTTRDLVLLAVDSPKQITIRRGTLRGRVLRDRPEDPLEGLPVVVYYQGLSQEGVGCPLDPGGECAVAVGRTAADGSFAFENVVAGALRIHTFDQAAFQEGGVRVVLAPDGVVDVNVAITGGFGTVRGIVLDADGNPVPNAEVGGGLALTRTDSDGKFLLADVPLGLRRPIVAVSQALGSKATVEVDLVRPGEEVGATLVLAAVGAVSGTVTRFDGSPASGIKVFLIVLNDPDRCPSGFVCVVGEATTNSQGGYLIEKIPTGKYVVSAFTSDFSDGNFAPAVVKFHGQVVRADVKFLGGNGGRVEGTVFSCSGAPPEGTCPPENRTPLKAKVSVSGDQLVIAGGRVAVKFQYVQNFRIGDTDLATGHYSLGGLWPGRFTLRAAGQFSPDPIAFEHELAPPGATVQADLQLRPTSRIAGRVLRPDGVTPVGKDVILRYRSDEFVSFCSETSGGEMECEAIPQGIQETSQVTDDGGRFLFPLVNAGTFTITAEDPATGKTARLKGSVKAGETLDVELRLLGVADVEVQVLGSDGVTPIPGAEVVVEQLDLERTDPKRKLTRIAGTQGAERGIARFAGGDALTEGLFVVKATDIAGNGFSGRASGKVVKDGEAVTVKVFLFDQTGSVSGRVLRRDGTPAVNAEVVITAAGGGGPDRPGGLLAHTITDGSGGFSYDAIPVGKFGIEIFDPATAGRATASGEIFVKGQHVGPIVIVEDPLSVVRGTLVEVGTLKPLRGWRVTFSQQRPSGWPISLVTTSAADGGFSFPGASVGFFRLHAERPGAPGSAVVEGTISRPGEVVDIPLVALVPRPAFGRIEGKVSRFDGSPAANAKVGICPSDFSCDVENPRVAITAGPDGTFAADGIPLGRHTVVARAQDSADSGLVFVDLAFDGDTAPAHVVLAGLNQVSVRVRRQTGEPVTTARVDLFGDTFDRRQAFFDSTTGRYEFRDLSVRSFTAVAVDQVSGLKGSASDVVSPGEHKEVEIVLEPTGVVFGEVRFANGTPAVGVVAELSVGTSGGPKRLFARSGADGRFAFEAAPIGQFTLQLQDAVGPGVARRTGTVSDRVDLGTITLDEAPPAVASTDPTTGATGVPVGATVRIAFNEPVDPGSVNLTNIVLAGPAGPVAGSLQMTQNDTVALFTPLAALQPETRYDLRVTGVRDRVGKAMTAQFRSTFTTVDLTPPGVVDISPAPNTSGVALESAIRIKFSKPIDTAAFRGPPSLLVTGVSGAPVPGRLDFILGNTVVVFTPDAALAPDTIYRVQAPAARDLSGNVQAAGLDYTFGTTDRTPPVIAGLTASNGGRVVENGIATVAAEVGAQHDVLLVDFFLNGAFAATTRAPFQFSFQAVPALGGPGAQIQVSAVATDTSGNRGLPASTVITVTPDLPPTAAIVSPAPGASFGNGQSVTVVVELADDLGVRQAAFKAETGRPQDAAVRAVDPPSAARTERFTFAVPADAAPGTSIVLRASAIDTKGQSVEARPVTITVLDTVAPSVAVTGATTGDRALPGQQTTVVVSAQDAGGIASITFKATGAALSTQTRVIDPPQPSVVTTFTVTVPSSARPTESLRLDATATDRAGNTGAAAQIVLPVADRSAPTVTLRTQTGGTEIVRGRPFTVVATVEDDLAVTQVELTGSGAFEVLEARQVTPPLATGEVSFTLTVPDNAQPGAVLDLAARASDFAGNRSAPARLSLVVRALPEVTFSPASLLLVAGRSGEATMQLSEPAPAGGLSVTLQVDPAVATAAGPVTFAAGESSKTITIAGVAGGTVFLRALIGDVDRGGMTVSVQGGIVSGFVRDQQLQPVAGAKVTVTSVFPPATTETDGEGRYFLQGIASQTVTVKVQKDVDATTRLLGFATGSMNRPNGFVELDIVLVQAGLIRGTVRLADGSTLAGEGVRVDLFEARNLRDPIATDFTDAGSAYEFPLIALGDYVVEASAGGNRGRTSVTLTTSGEERTVHVSYLGRGVIRGQVVDAFGNRVATATVTLWSASLFGPAPPISRPVRSDGTFEFDDVFVGTFTLQARDAATNQAATATGSIERHGQEVFRELKLSSFGGLTGIVYRGSGAGRTIVSGATVRVHNIVTETDDTGRYTINFLPLGPFTVSVRHESTRGIGLASGTLTQPGVLETADVTLFGQGTLAVTVQDAGGNGVKGASLSVQADNGLARDVIDTASGDGGLVVVEHVLAGNVFLFARSGALVGSTTVRLAEGETKSVVVRLQPSGSIAGTVFEPDGVTPARGGTVRVEFTGMIAAIGLDGTYRVDGLPLTPPGGAGYTLVAFDAQNRMRAKVKQPIVLSLNGQVATADMTWVGLGTVKGQVLNPAAPDGSGGADLTVTVRSLHPDFGRTYSARTNAAGFYEVQDVVAGDVTASVVHPALRLRGEGAGRVAGHGAVETINLTLQNNLIDLPVTRWDANNAVFDIQPNGSILAGSASVFHASVSSRGAALLEIVRDGASHAFTGTTIGTFEDGGREIALTQNDLAGLSVTRKVFVPRAGYFARYLELLTNPTESPVTVDVRLRTHLSGGSSGASRVIATSSGDAALDVADAANPDRWLVADDGTDLEQSGLPAVALVFDGPEAAVKASAAAFAPLTSGAAQAAWEWTNLTIPPGETVALMHFLVQQVVRGSAQAAAERLAQLPPEALAGLGAEELPRIRNFAVPTDGTSALPALPSLEGTVSGRVLAADGTTTVANVAVRFRSANPLFPRTLQATSAADGTFGFAGALADGGQSRAVPVDGFTLGADGPASTTSPVVSGRFVGEAATIEQNVVFGNTGVLRGVARLNGSPVQGATILASGSFQREDGGFTAFTLSATSAADGTFVIPIVPPAAMTVQASVVHQGATRRTSTAVSLAAGATVTVALDIDTIAPQVAIAGPAEGAQVDPRSPLAVTVEASDAGGLVEIAFAASGALSAAETRPIAPPAAARSELFTVPFPAPLPTGGSLTLTVTAKDGAGNQTTATRAVAVLDVVPPAVVLIDPPDAAVDVDPNTTITVQFSEPIARASVTEATLRLATGGTAVPVTYGFSNGDRTVTLTPVARPLALGATFTVTVGSGVTDPAGNGMAAPVAASFTTTPPDVTPPRVAAIVPAHNAVDVPPATFIEVTFSEPIDPATVTDASFRVSTGGAAVAGVRTMLDGNRRVRFTPSGPLPFAAVVVTELTAAIADLAGNALADADGRPLTQPLTFTFLTSSFGITRPARGESVVEKRRIVLEAQASAGLGVATVVFEVNGQALPPVSGPTFATTAEVPARAQATTLRIVAIGRNSSGAEVARDELVADIVAGLSAQPTLLGVPRGGSSTLRLGLSSPIATDLPVTLTAADASIVTLPAGPIVIPAGRTEVKVTVGGAASGNTTIVGTSTRGEIAVVASVSDVTPKTLAADAPAAGVRVLPAVSLGRVFLATAGQRSVTLQLLGAPAGSQLAVSVASTNPAVARVEGSVSIPAGEQSAAVTIVTGDPGSATLTFRAGGEVRQLAVVVGTPPAGTLGPILAAPAGVRVLPAVALGRIVAAPAGQIALVLALVAEPAASPTTVTVTSSDPAVASVSQPVVVPAGERSAAVAIATGAPGSATLTFRAGGEVRELAVHVGTPPAGSVPLAFARPAGVRVLPAVPVGVLFEAVTTPRTLSVQLLAQPRSADTPVGVSTSDPNIAAVTAPITIPAGSVSATFTVATGAEGVATLVFEAAGEKRELVVVVGNPPPSRRPVLVAPPVGVEIKQ
jgi:hypothetical protein